MTFIYVVADNDYDLWLWKYRFPFTKMIKKGHAYKGTAAETPSGVLGRRHMWNLDASPFRRISAVELLAKYKGVAERLP